MLKPKYDREDQIPDNLKGAYVPDPSGVYVLDQLDAEHPVLKKNAELVRENTSTKGLNTRLMNEKTSLESRSIPEGYVAVKAEDAPLIDKVKAIGIPVDELATIKTENETFKKQQAERSATNIRRGAASKLGYNPDAFAPLAKDLDIVQEGDDYFVNVKNEKGAVEKKALTSEFISGSDAFKPFLSSLSATPLTPGNTHDPRPQGGASGLYDRIRESVKKQNETASAPVSIDQRFGKAA